jgi:hypothetical protein
MAWFQLDPQSIADRCRSAGSTVPSLTASVVRGALGFAAVSVAGFVPWAVFGRWLYRQVGEAGMYAACAVVFLGLTGPVLHRLILGPGSLRRFNFLFVPAFVAYSVAWIGFWMALARVNGHLAGVAGLLSGTAIMGWMLVTAFGSRDVLLRVVTALFVFNTAGYFVGGEAMGLLMRHHRQTAMLAWGVFYGLGMGAGLGVAFHLCQARARDLLRAAPDKEPDPQV